jgi:hypothetical protein
MQVVRKTDVDRQKEAESEFKRREADAQKMVADAKDAYDRAVESAENMIAAAEEMVNNTKAVTYSTKKVKAAEGVEIETAAGPGHVEKGFTVLTGTDGVQFAVNDYQLENEFQET